MTTAIDQSAQRMLQLINSCYQAREEFCSAAEAVDDSTLKRLFAIYAQQRTRFAEELRAYLREDVSDDTPAAKNTAEWCDSEALTGSSEERLRCCLRTDARCLRRYREALLDRSLPTRAHFVISAQMSLLQRVHDRLRGLVEGGSELMRGLNRDIEVRWV